MVTNVDFRINSLNSDAYNLELNFLDAESKLVSKKTVTFVQQSLPESNPDTVIDLCTNNGIIKERETKPNQMVRHIFRSKHLKEAELACKLYDINYKSKSENDGVLVLDLAHPTTKYQSDGKDIIKTWENSIGEFLKTPEKKVPKSNVEKIQACFKNRLDFIIYEGSLKVDLLNNNFSEEETDFFLNQRPTGPKMFCQFAEFFMNGFKFGQTASLNGLELNASQYLHSLGEDSSKIFSGKKKSIVYYPPEYTDIETTAYATTIGKCFNINYTSYNSDLLINGSNPIITEMVLDKKEK